MTLHHDDKQHPDSGPTTVAPAQPETTIVVGVDGSPSSQRALRWAAAQAELAGARLRVVSSWHVPDATAFIVPNPGRLDWETATSQGLVRTLQDTLGENPGIPITVVVVEGPPALALLAQAKDADLLVVGSRGHGEFTGMLLGSVSEHCVTHAPCPVVVVPNQRQAPTKERTGQDQQGRLEVS